MDPNCLNTVNMEQDVQLYKFEFYLVELSIGSCVRLSTEPSMWSRSMSFEACISTMGNFAALKKQSYMG